jgi:hypothetical protein
MTKGKYKRKKEHTSQNSQQSSSGAIIVDEKKTPDGQTDAAGKAARKASDGQKPSRWEAFKQHIGGTLFTNQCIAAFTFVLASAAIYQFIITDSQLGAMRKDLRAWISVDRKGLPEIAIDKVPSIEVVIENTGKTPATNVVSHFYIEVIPNGQKPHFEAAAMHTSNLSGVMIPHAIQNITVSREKADVDEGDPLLPSEQKALDEGKAWLAFHGIVWYDDTFKTKHWIRFCIWSPVKPGKYDAAACTQYNQVDNK